MASPSSTAPSKGITFPMWITTRSSSRICDAETRSSCSPIFCHTLLTFRDMVRARSSTDFLCVHSSRSSPTPSRNMTEEAVSISPRNTETPIAAASRTGTSIFPFTSVSTPFFRYFTDFTAVTSARRDQGTNSFEAKRSSTFITSFS